LAIRALTRTMQSARYALAVYRRIREVRFSLLTSPADFGVPEWSKERTG